MDSPKPVTPVGGSCYQKGQFPIYEAFQLSLEAAVPFTGVEPLFEAIDATPGDDDAYRTGHVTLSHIDDVMRERERRGRKFRLWYVEDMRLLIVTIPSGRHESASRHLHSEVSRQLMDMSLFYELVPRGSETHSGRGLGGAAVQMEADESWAPRARAGLDLWPTLVIEVGFTQSLQELRAKAQTWFQLSSLNVKDVLLAKLSSTQRSMTVEKWKVLPEESGSGPEASAGAAVLEPQCAQTVTVPVQEGPQDSGVVNTEVRLEFADLFLRQPWPDEKDIVISTDRLQEIANVIFSL